MLVTAKARLTYLSIPPRKMRLVANTVKGMAVEKALNILNFTPKIAAFHLAKTLKSAAANALSIEGTDHLKPEDLRVSNIVVDAAPSAKRIRFQSMGRVHRYKKRFCHLTVELEGETMVTEEKKTTGATRKKSDKPAKKTVKKTAARKTVKKTAAKKSSVKKTAAKTTAKKTTVKKKTSASKTDRK